MRRIYRYKKKPYVDTFQHKVKVFTGKQAARIFLWKAQRRGNRIMSDVKFGGNSQALQGKLTYVSLAIGALTLIFQFLGKEFPEEEAKQLVTWAESNWPMLMQLAAIVTAFYGRLRREWRKFEDVKPPSRR